jgi:hypothetical protein
MSKEKSADLVEIRDILKKELKKFTNVQSTLQQTTDGFNKVDTNYSKYESEIDESKKHINELRKKEFYENLYVYIGFGFFLCCVSWILLKRFPLHRIIFIAYNFLEYLIGLAISAYNITIAYLNKETSNTHVGYNTTSLANTVLQNNTIRNITIKITQNITKLIN